MDTPKYKYRIISTISTESGVLVYKVQSKDLEGDPVWITHNEMTSLEGAQHNLRALKIFRARAEAYGVKVEHEE
jgi:hypothetical protein